MSINIATSLIRSCRQSRTPCLERSGSKTSVGLSLCGAALIDTRLFGQVKLIPVVIALVKEPISCLGKLRKLSFVAADDRRPMNPGCEIAPAFERARRD